MQQVSRQMVPPAHVVETRLSLVNEPLSGGTGIDEDHARDLLGPALRVKPRLHAAQRVPHQNIRSRYGPGLERRVQVIHHVGEDLWPWARVAEAIAGSIETADARVLRDRGLDLVPDRRPAR